MKNLFFTLLFALLAITGNAQKRVQIRATPTSPVLYEAFGPAPNRSLYPNTSAGKTAYLAAANAGQFTLTTVVGGCVIPAGTRPPKVLPTCTTSGVSWITGLLYSHNGTTLTVKGNGQIGAMSFAYLNGSPFTTTNPDNAGPLQNGMFYGYGTNSSPPGYDKQWQLNLGTLPMRITAQKQGDASQTKSYTFSPSSGQTDIAIVGSVTTPPTTTTTSTPVSYNQQILAKNQPGTGQVIFQNTIGPFANSGQYTTYGFTAPGSGNATMTLWYQTNWGSSESGQGTYIVNGGSPVDFPLQGADGGSRTPTFTVPLVQGANTIRVQGKSNSFYQQYINLAGTLTQSSSGTVTPPPSQTVTPPNPPPTTGTVAWNMNSSQLNALGLNGNFIAAADQGWNITTTREKYIESADAKIGFNRGGGIITYAALKRDNRILINTHQVGYHDNDPNNLYAQIPGPYDDLGRSWESIVDYCWPGPNDNNGQGLRMINGKTSGGGYKGHVFNTGGNVVQGGSMEPALDLSPILASATYPHPTRGTESYIRTRPKIWGMKNEDGWIVGEQWTSFVAPNVIYVFVRRTVEARDPARFVDYQTPGNTYSQENPCLYVVRDLVQKYINIPGEPRKNIDPGPEGDAPKYFTLDGRIGAYNGTTGVTYVSRLNTQVGAFNRTPEGYSGGESSWAENNTAYIQGAPARNYDNPGIYDDAYYVVLGSESEANAAIANLPGFSQNFDYDFTKEGMLFANYEGPMKRENGVWTLGIIPNYDQGNFGGYNAKMYSPAQAWNASGITQMNYEIAVTGTTSLALRWQKPGLNYANEFSKDFTVQADGQYRTYTVSTNDGNWNGIISRIGIGTGSGTSSAGTIKVRRIWKN